MNFQKIELNVLRVSIVLILLWYGVFKFIPTEAKAIVGIMEASPLFSRLYVIFSVQGASNFIGIFELITEVLIAIGYFKPDMDFYVGILSFLLSSEGMFNKVDWLYVPNSFVIKDLIFLGYSLYLIGCDRAELKDPKS